MTDETPETTTEAEAPVEATNDLTGWTREHIERLDAELGERVERFVRYHNAHGARLRPVDSVRNSKRTVTVQVLDEKGERVDLSADKGNAWLTRFEGAVHGLTVVIDFDENTAVLAVAAAPADAPAEPARTRGRGGRR